jgi:hypothetical protein
MFTRRELQIQKNKTAKNNPKVMNESIRGLQLKQFKSYKVVPAGEKMPFSSQNSSFFVYCFYRKFVDMYRYYWTKCN